MFKGLLYLIGFIFVVLIITGNTFALTVFFGAVLVLSIGHAIIEKIDRKKKS